LIDYFPFNGRSSLRDMQPTTGVQLYGQFDAKRPSRNGTLSGFTTLRQKSQTWNTIPRTAEKTMLNGFLHRLTTPSKCRQKNIRISKEVTANQVSPDGQPFGRWLDRTRNCDCKRKKSRLASPRPAEAEQEPVAGVAVNLVSFTICHADR